MKAVGPIGSFSPQTTGPKKLSSQAQKLSSRAFLNCHPERSRGICLRSLALLGMTAIRLSSRALKLSSRALKLSSRVKRGISLHSNQTKPAKTLSLILATAALLAVPMEASSKWHATPAVSLQELYSSNIDLLPSGFETEEFVTELAPSLYLENQSRKLPFSAFYRAQGLHYAHDSRANKIYQQAWLNTRASVMQDHVILELTGDHGQTILFPSQSIGVDNISGAQRTDVSRLFVSPEIHHNIGKALKAFWKYTFGRLIYYQSTPDVNVHQARASIESSGLTKLYLSLTGHWEQTLRENQTLTKTLDGLITLGYQITSKLRPYVSWGYEDHTGQTGYENLDGERWHIGMLYTPTKRLSMNGYYGHRSFGKDLMGSITWFHKHQSFSASYQQSVTNYYQSQLQGLQNLQATSLGLTTVQFQPEYRNDLFILKNYSLSWDIIRPHWSLHLSPYIERRIPIASTLEERGVGFNGQLSVQRTKNMTLTLLGGLSHQKLITALMDKRYQMGAQLRHQIATNTVMDYQYNHIEIHREGMLNIKEDTVSIRISWQS